MRTNRVDARRAGVVIATGASAHQTVEVLMSAV